MTKIVCRRSDYAHSDFVSDECQLDEIVMDIEECQSYEEIHDFIERNKGDTE